MQFKKEASLLVIAIALFAVATFLYTYQATSEGITLMSKSIAYPYREIALAFVGIGFASMVVASISFTKKTKTYQPTQPV
ncbi:MAG: hypothetical protein ACM3UY_09830 [Methanocella sp.]|jgi:hypothetical protein